MSPVEERKETLGPVSSLSTRSMCPAGERVRHTKTQEASWASNKTVVRLGLGNKRGTQAARKLSLSLSLLATLRRLS